MTDNVTDTFEHGLEISNAINALVAIQERRHETQLEQLAVQKKQLAEQVLCNEILAKIEDSIKTIEIRASDSSLGLYTIYACHNTRCNDGWRLSRAAFDMAIERAQATEEVQSKLDTPTPWRKR